MQGEVIPESMTNKEKIISEALDTIKRYHKEHTRLRGLLERANMALLMYTQSHGTPAGTELLGELAKALGLDADGNTKELKDE